MAPTRVRRQHVVSKFYLKGFAKESRLLTKTVIPGKISHPISVNDATVNTDYYSVELEDGTLSDVFETAFSEIEGPASGAFRGLLATPVVFPNGDGRQALSAWIALQYLRSPAIRAQRNELHANLMRVVVGVVGKAGLRNFIQEREGITISDARVDAEWSDLTKPGGPTTRARAENHIMNVFELLPETTERLYNGRWMAINFNRKTLVAGDHPVFLMRDPDAPSWHGVGLENADAFGLSLSRHRGLVIFTGDGEPGSDIMAPGTAVEARTLNAQTIQNARAAIYHHPDDDPVSWFEGSLPDPRQTELTAGMDGLIMPDAEGYPAPARDVGDTIDPDGLSLANLVWPIRDRIFVWTEPGLEVPS